MKSIRISRPGWLLGSCARQQSKPHVAMYSEPSGPNLTPIGYVWLGEPNWLEPNRPLTRRSPEPSSLTRDSRHQFWLRSSMNQAPS